MTNPMTSPMEQDYGGLRKRLHHHHEHPVTGQLVLRNPDGPSAAEAISKLVAERDDAKHYLEAFAEAHDIQLKRMEFGDGELQVQLGGKAIERIAVAMVTEFKEFGATNYIEMNIYDRDEPFQRYTVTIQKVGALSPADKANAALARAEAAEQTIAGLTADMAAAVEAEREECAKTAEARKSLYGLSGNLACREVASSIRARRALAPESR